MAGTTKSDATAASTPIPPETTSGTPASVAVRADGSTESTVGVVNPDSATAKQKATEPVKVEGASKVKHLERCPKARLEAYDAPGADGKPVRVVRCIDCGERAKV
jgi:hypothetical protein